MRVAAVQLEVTLADVPANLATCESLARDAARAGAQAIALGDRRRRGTSQRAT